MFKDEQIFESILKFLDFKDNELIQIQIDSVVSSYNARAAINSYNNYVNYYGRRNNHCKVELAKFELVEVPVDGN